MTLRTSLLFLGALGLTACGSKSTASGSSSSQGSAKPAVSASSAAASPSTGGELDVRVDKDQATKLKIGPAFVDLYPHWDNGSVDENGKELPPTGYSFAVRVFNDQIKGVGCDTKLLGDKPIGGSNWALFFDSENSETWQVGSKEPIRLSPAFYFTDSLGAHGQAPWWSSNIQKNEVKVESFSEKSVTFSVQIEAKNLGDDGPGWVRGKFTAKVCEIEK